MYIPLNPATMEAAARELADRDDGLADVVATWGIPPLWQRPRGFESLVYIIIGQQVSLASARAVFLRLRERLDSFTPDSYLALDDDALREAGLSRQKTLYTRELAHKMTNGAIDIDALPEMPVESARALLTSVKGIGEWTASIYQMLAILHPDIWPTGDRALAVAVKAVQGLASVPDPEALSRIGDRYRPWRSVATRLYWYHYLAGGSPAPEMEVQSV